MSDKIENFTIVLVKINVLIIWTVNVNAIFANFQFLSEIGIFDCLEEFLKYERSQRHSKWENSLLFYILLMDACNHYSNAIGSIVILMPL